MISTSKKTIFACLLLTICPLASAQITSSDNDRRLHPDYRFVFSDNKINSLKIKISRTDWELVNADMTIQFGGFGQQKAMTIQRPSMPVPPRDGLSASPESGGIIPSSAGNPAPNVVRVKEPEYVAVSVNFNGVAMDRVGFRLKGNSSLISSWASGIYKLPFRLDFAKYGSQSLFGFHELSLSPAFHDNSLIREKVASDLFRMAGVHAPQTSFCKVYIDFGNGTKYCGLYTIVEVVDDTMVKDQFGEEQGNIYKPESTFSYFDKAQFEKKNNKKAADWSDVQAAIMILNAPGREKDALLWRKELETVFNVDVFIRWLAMNTVMTCWDSYGSMPHNYYLYHSSEKKLTWIPWDLNEAMSVNTVGLPKTYNGRPSHPDPGHGQPPPTRKQMPQGLSLQGVDLSLKSVAPQWPLIRYLADDSVYYARYKRYVYQFSRTLFSPERMDEIIDRYHKLIAKDVADEKNPYSHLNDYQSFINELAALKRHVRKRRKNVEDFMSE